MADAAGVAKVFSTLVWEDSDQIAGRAQAFLEEFGPSYFADETLRAESLEDSLRMDLFGASVLAYLESKEADVELSVEHDIATWIEANAPAVTSANLRIMESALGEDGTATHREVVKLHQLIVLETYDSFQQRVLETVWSDVEMALSDVMSAAAR